MKKQILSNKLKTAFIIGIIIALLSLVVYFITYSLGFGRYAVVVAVGVSCLTSLYSYWNSSKIVLKINKAKPADHVIHEEAYRALKRVSYLANIPEPKLYIMNDASPNAFATGRNPKNSVVCLTTGLMEKLDYYQLEGVIAHEMAHIANYDILISTIASVMIGIVIMASDIWSRSLWFSSYRRRNDRNSGGGLLAIIGIIFVIIAPIAGQLLRFSLSRNREYLADSTGASYTGNPEGLASALAVIGGDSSSVKTANNATANMFISDPMRAVNAKRRTNLFSTHPDIQDRIQRLRNMKYNY